MTEASASASPAPAGETNGAPAAQDRQESSTMTEEHWKAIKSIVDRVYAYRQTDGHDPSKIFHRKVNRRLMPEYYEIIKEPVALSTLKSKILTKGYQSFTEFVRDCALISHNAQTYNRPEAGAYQDALVIREFFVKELKRLLEQGVITAVEATPPDLGEIPPASPRPLDEEEEVEEEDEDDEDDEDEDMDDSEDEGKKKKRRGPRSTAAITKREGGGKDDSQKDGDIDPRKRRGRPPRVDTPMEARIKAVLKGIRKFKNDAGHIMIHQFEKLPDKTIMPEYYQEIKEPIAVELIKRKHKRKKYQSMDQFLRDIDTMFNNAKSYNQDESQIYKDAVYLQQEAHNLADAEKAKPDTDYVMEEGRLPLPNGILNNGELWKVGDWVHIQNPNDVTKPIAAQIYRTWQDNEGQKWVNACWYYRPEQTVHQYEKHFYPNEVVKTGQYRDHHIDEIVDRCFIMFCTRYSRGRPRGFPSDKEVYVCDSRYNEEKHKLNKIKTWASCLPDEVRDKDYEMDLFDRVKKVKKLPSPLLHLLPEDANETDELPKPQWGVDNAPPIVGAVYQGPRDENQSPPPEPTPSPPPQPPPPPPRQSSHIANRDTPSYRKNSEVDAPSSVMAQQPSVAAPSPTPSTQPSSHTAQLPQYHTHSASPAPTPSHQQHYSQQLASYAQPQPSNIAPSQSSSHLDHYTTQQSRYQQPSSAYRSTTTAMSGYNAPRPVEVYRLPDSANAAIPKDIREQFQRDEEGHVLFFTTPPVDLLPPVGEGTAIGHTAKYLANKLRRKLALKEKREAEGLPPDDRAPAPKRVKVEQEEPSQQRVKALRDRGLRMLIDQMNQGTEAIYKDIYGDAWQEGMKDEQARLRVAQADAARKNADLEASERKRREAEKVDMYGTGVYLDDYDPRY